MPVARSGEGTPRTWQLATGTTTQQGMWITHHLKNEHLSPGPTISRFALKLPNSTPATCAGIPNRHPYVIERLICSVPRERKRGGGGVFSAPTGRNGQPKVERRGTNLTPLQGSVVGGASVPRVPRSTAVPWADCQLPFGAREPGKWQVVIIHRKSASCQVARLPGGPSQDLATCHLPLHIPVANLAGCPLQVATGNSWMTG